MSRAYAAVVLLAVAWAWYLDVSLLNDKSEHMLPDMLLFLVAWPTTLTLIWVPESLTNGHLAGLAWMTACGAFQASLLCWLCTSRRVGGKR